MFYKTTCIFILLTVSGVIPARAQGLHLLELLDRMQHERMGKLGVSKYMLTTEVCDFGKTTLRTYPATEVDSLGRIIATYKLADSLQYLSFRRTYTKTGKVDRTLNYKPDGKVEYASQCFYDDNDSLILADSRNNKVYLRYETCGDTILLKRSSKSLYSERLESITYITENGKRQLTLSQDGNCRETLKLFDEQHRILYEEEGQRFRLEGYRFASSTQYTYDDRGRLISSQFRAEGNSVSLFALRMQYEYEGDKLIKIVRTKGTGNIDSLVFQWNKAGQISCIILHDKYETYEGSIIHLFYHENGLLREQHSQGFNMRGDDYFAITRYTYP